MTSQTKPSKRKKRRKSSYDAPLGRAMAKLFAEGWLVQDVAERFGIAPRRIREWASDPEHPFSPLYARAREVGYQKLADELFSISDDGRNDWMQIRARNGEMIEVVNKEAIERSRLRVDTRKWVLSKMLPKIYGDKLDVNAKHEAGDSFKALWSMVASGQVA